MMRWQRRVARRALECLLLATCGSTVGCPSVGDPPLAERKAVGPAEERAEGEPVAEARPARGARGTRGATDGAPPGKWRPVADLPGLSARQRELAAQLEAIGYADGTQAVEVAHAVTVHDPARAYRGLNLYNSGHAAEAFLVDMDARVLHRWSARFREVFPDVDVEPEAPGTNHWRRVVLAADGDLYGIWEGRGLVRLDARSGVRWARANGAHHHLALLDGGRRVAVLTREVGIEPRLDPENPVLADFVDILDAATGETLRRISLIDALLDGPYAHLLAARRRSQRDVLHTNSLYVLDGAIEAVAPAFAKGDLLLTWRNLSAVGVLDVESGIVTWAHRGDYDRPHDARITPSGRLLLFDNRGGPKRTSRVLAFAPATMELVWSWAGTDPEQPLRSPTLGTAQELPNGNVLVTESERGHAVEITPDGTVVWEFWNPHRAGEGGTLVAALFEVLRLSPDLDAAWVAGDDASSFGDVGIWKQ